MKWNECSLFVYSKACRRIWVKPRPCQINRVDHPKIYRTQPVIHIRTRTRVCWVQRLSHDLVLLQRQKCRKIAGGTTGSASLDCLAAAEIPLAYNGQRREPRLPPHRFRRSIFERILRQPRTGDMAYTLAILSFDRSYDRSYWPIEQQIAQCTHFDSFTWFSDDRHRHW